MSFFTRFSKSFAYAHRELSPYIKFSANLNKYISMVATPIISTYLVKSPEGFLAHTDSLIKQGTPSLDSVKSGVKALNPSLDWGYSLATSEISAHFWQTPQFNLFASLLSLPLGKKAFIENTANLFVVTPIVKEAVCKILPHLVEIPVSALSGIYGLHQALTHSDADVAAKTSAVSLSGEIVFLDEIL